MFHSYFIHTALKLVSETKAKNLLIKIPNTLAKRWRNTRGDRRILQNKKYSKQCQEFYGGNFSWGNNIKIINSYIHSIFLKIFDIILLRDF